MNHQTINQNTAASEQVIARSIEGAAKAIGVGRSTLYELIAAGDIRTFKVGERRLVPETELHRFVAERMAVA